MISGAATAALVELDPRDDRRRAALFVGLAQTGGSALGPLVAGVLAQWAPEPLRLPFFAGLGATLAAGAWALTLPETPNRTAERWRIEWPRVPKPGRRAFLRVSLTAATSWAAVALYLSIVPSYAAAFLNTHNLAVLAAIAALALVSSSGSQFASRRWGLSLLIGEGIGLSAIAARLVALVAAHLCIRWRSSSSERSRPAPGTASRISTRKRS